MFGKVARITAGTAGLVALAGTTVVVVASAAQAAPTKAAKWGIVKRVHSGPSGDFTAVTATGKGSAWGFDGNSLAAPDAGPAAWRLSGKTWTRVAFPGKRNEFVVAAGGTSAANAWAFTDVLGGSRVLRWNGHRWSVVRTFAKPIGGASVVSPNDVWVFGQPEINTPEQLGVWHYNGHRWARVAVGLDGGSALSASNVWAFDGTFVDHYTGHGWSHTSVASLLPRRTMFNDPIVLGIYAQSPSSVYAIGNGNLQDDGGPLVVLHYNGHSWRRVAEGNFGYGTQPSQQIAPDGRGGLWLPMPGFAGHPSYLVHYSGGKLIAATLPGGSQGVDVESIANIPGSTEMLAGGFTHARANPAVGVVGVILQYAG